MDRPDNIIVIHSFDDVIEANIVKTKLDAYGIPCFLSQENLTSLTTALLSGGVRLHIFEQDRDEVLRLFMEESIKHVDDDLLLCPTCRSRKILKLEGSRFDPSRVVKFILQLTKRHYCVECEAEFD